MEDLRLKRRAIELGHLEAWLGRGHGSFHFENLDILKTLVHRAISLAGLMGRGERNALNPVVNHLTFEFPNLPRGFDGFRILHLSDIHVDALPGFAQTVCDQVSQLPVDLCVLTGDYRFEIHGPCHNVYHHMEKILRSIKARLGVVGILGNHDFAEMIGVLEGLGVKMLINQSLELHAEQECLWVIGLDDPHYYGCDDLAGASRDVPADAFKVLLVHSPELIKEAAAAGIALYLCGHTHGGQIRLPLVGPLLTNANCARKYTRGAWKFQTVTGYTNAGVGSSCVPVRFGCPPEIAVIELRRCSGN
jgi:predicted MPP superfamily phosphohydrolase